MALNPCPLDTKFFLTMYGSQETLNLPQWAHTFAVFSKSEFLADGSANHVHQTISWLHRDSAHEVVTDVLGNFHRQGTSLTA